MKKTKIAETISTGRQVWKTSVTAINDVKCKGMDYQTRAIHQEELKKFLTQNRRCSALHMVNAWRKYVPSMSIKPRNITKGAGGAINLSCAHAVSIQLKCRLLQSFQSSRKLDTHNFHRAPVKFYVFIIFLPTPFFFFVLERASSLKNLLSLTIGVEIKVYI